jgi:hypothetical protein
MSKIRLGVERRQKQVRRIACVNSPLSTIG